LARNILQSKELLFYKEPLVFGSQEKSTYVNKKRKYINTASCEFLKIWPNPAQDYLIIDFSVKPIKNHLTLTITNTNGLIYLQLILKKYQDQMVYITKNLPKGTYILTLHSADRPIESKKFIIIR
jgi:hypothetical protein